MPSSFFNLNISAQVVVRGADGASLSFPAEHLRRFVSHNGVQGRFELKYDARNKFVSLEKLS